MIKEVALTADEWNAKYQTGTVVRYWAGARMGPGRLSRTRTEAYTYSSSNGPMVGVQGRSGGFALTHVQPVEATQEDWAREYRLREIDEEQRALREAIRVGPQKRIEELQREFDALQKEVPC